MNDTLKVLMVGCGSMSAAWLDTAAGEPGLETVGLVDIQRDSALRRAREYGMDPRDVFDDLDLALRHTRPDVVFDCTVPEAHHAVTMKALSAGCHVLGEKPLADSMEHARQMVRRAEDAGKLYAVMQNRRYLPTAPAMVEFLRSGVIGDITTVNVDFYIGAFFSGFRAEMPHPLLLDMAIHTFDQARQFSGADPVEVYCRAFHPEGSRYRGKASAMCVFRMSDDIVFNYRGSWCSQGYNTPWAGAWRIIGTRGTALWDEGAPRAQVAEPGHEQFIADCNEIVCDAAPLEVAGHPACIREFIHCIRTGQAPQTVGSDNIKSLAMVFAAIESDTTGQTVRM